jgi:LysM repeat protein
MRSGNANRRIGWWAAAYAVGLSIALALLSGCGQNLEENPTIIALAKRLESIEADVKSMRAELDSTYDDVNSLKQSATELKDGVSRVQTVDTRLAKIEKDLAGVGTAVEQLKKARPVAAREVTAEGKPAEEKPSAKRELQKETYAIPKGFYYTTQKDDTLESVASKFKVSTGELLLKNHLPAGVKLYPGQQIFIPKLPE